MTALEKCCYPSRYRSRMKENLMTVQEVAEHLHLSPHTIYKWVEKGRIPVIRLGYCVRFRPSDIAEFEEQRYVPAFRTVRKRSATAR
jgi:excisionase family DNA binding protein